MLNLNFNGMKKLLITMCAMLVGMVAFAGNPLSVVNTKVQLKKFMKQEAKACLVIDWSQAKFDNKKAAADEFGDDYEFIKKDCAENFIEGFNNETKGIEMRAEENGATYKFLIIVENLDAFVNAFWGGGRTEAKVWGKLTIIDLSNGDTLAEVRIDEAEGGSDFVRRESFGETFAELGETVAKIK